MMKKYVWILFSLLIAGGCESLEDTYSDYAGDGAVRYLGKCTDIAVTPGWKRLNVTWRNSIDPVVEKIRVSWTLNGITRDSLIGRGATECSIPDLEDGNYEVAVRGVDGKGNGSLPISAFGRPYTPAHEAVRAFSRLIGKYYFVGNRLVLFFSSWQENIVSATLNYYSGGSLRKLELNKELLSQEQYLLPDAIDPGTEVFLEREGRLEGCTDLIVFDPWKLLPEKLYTTDFRRLVKEKYGQAEITDAFVNGQEELEIDYEITSFEDILNFTNLKTLVLGKNRFLKEEYLNYYRSDSKLNELERGLFVLDVANKVYGLKVKRYNQHYLPGKTLPYMEEMGNPVAPDIPCMDGRDWKITCSEKDSETYDAHLENLFDGNLLNWWQPEALLEVRTYEIMVDMKETKTVNGVKIVQKDFDPENDPMSRNLLPSRIKIRVSADNMVWKEATYVEENTLGASSGEINILKFSAPKEARYLKFIVSDRPYGKNFSVALAEIGVF